MNHSALLRVVTDEDTSAPRYAFGELSQSHMIYHPNLRVGLEDSLFIGKGELATSNAQQVRKIREIVESLGLEVATPAEARERLALKGADRVNF